MVGNLAIVIPAYKIEFLDRTLRSISDQTCKKFTLYIGDDASPSQLYLIVAKYTEKINIVYKRFNENLGGKDLVAHWSRCVDLVGQEDWIWFFSDDDLMECNCVELFYLRINTAVTVDLLHFNTQIIGADDEVIYKTRKFPKTITTNEFFARRLKNKIFSTAVEYVFRKNAFFELNGFQSFDLAWSSDISTWMKLSMRHGIDTIEGAVVKWRYSKINISSISDDRSIVFRKVNANISFLTWAITFFNQHNLVDLTSDMEKARWITSIVAQTTVLSYNEKYHLINDTLDKLHFNQLKFRITLLWIFREIKKKIKVIVLFNRLKDKSILMKLRDIFASEV